MEYKEQMTKMRCSHVTKEFPGNRKKSPYQVIGDLSFDVKENEFLVLFGPGQCGKTTLINMMAGLEPVTSGKIFHNNKEVEAPDASRGVVYQTLALFPFLTVEDNVMFGPQVQGKPKEECRRRAARFIELVGLQGFEKSWPGQLSGGMKQRVGIARAYCSDPDILLMDEPFGHLDAQTRYMMEEKLEEIWEKDKRTVVFVTNNIEEAIYLADRIILLSECPSQIKKEYRIDMERPRNLTDPRFLQIREEITAVMEMQG